jgi:DEAD/DEAH box helicase domain-containing protein
MCDRNDIGISMGGDDQQEQGDEPRVFIYDDYPGGIGFSEPLFTMHADLLARTRDLIAGCECERGCPTCVGPIGNTGPLAKVVALRILDLLAASRLEAGQAGERHELDVA